MKPDRKIQSGLKNLGRYPLGYFLRRILQFIPILIGVTLVTFVIFNLVGGDPAFQLAGKSATQEQIDSFREELGLGKPLYIQYLLFLKQILTMDWGTSWHTHQSINSMILAGIGPSLSLSLPAFLISFFTSLAISMFGLLAKIKDSFWDQLITSICLGLMSVSFLVYILFFQYYFAFYLDLFPINGWESGWIERWQYLVLPWLISVVVSIGPNTLLFRAALKEQMDHDYVKTGKAKGLSSWSLYWIHILRNAMIPIVTVIIIQLPFLITGSLLLEAFFGIPGLGGLLIQSLQNSDYPVIKALTVLGSILYMVFNLLSDFIYLGLDPRVKLR